MNTVTKAQRAALREAARNHTTPEALSAATGAPIRRCVTALEWVRRTERGEVLRGPGRSTGIKHGSYTTMFISDIHKAFARGIGGGNVSEGLRIALAEAMERRGQTTQGDDHA